MKNLNSTHVVAFKYIYFLFFENIIAVPKGSSIIMVLFKENIE